MFPRLQTIFLFLLCAATPLTSTPASEPITGEDLSIGWEDGRLTVTYTADPRVSVELQSSGNLLQWGPADVTEKISDTPDGTRLIKATVNSFAETFFRIRRAPKRELTLAWDAASDPAVAGYRVRLRRRGEGGLRRIDTGIATTTTLFLPEDGAVYSMDVVSYTRDGVESEPSNAIAIVVTGDSTTG